MRTPRVIAAALIALLATSALAAPAHATGESTTTVRGTALMQGGGAASGITILVPRSDRHLVRDDIAVTADGDDVAPDGSYELTFSHPAGASFYVVAHTVTSTHLDSYVLGASGASGVSHLQLAPIPTGAGTVTVPTVTVPRFGAITYKTSRAVRCANLLRLDGTWIDQTCADDDKLKKTFTFKNLIPGRYKLSADWSNFPAKGTNPTVRVVAGSTATVTDKIAAPAVLKGRVTDSATGKAVRGLRVTAYGHGENARAITNSKGYYTFTGLKAGTYAVTFTGEYGASESAKRYVGVERSAKVSTGKTRTVNAKVTRGGAVKVKVTHKGKGTVRVHVLTSKGKYVASAFTERSKAGSTSTTIKGLAPGTYRAVVVDPTRNRYSEKTVTVRANKTTNTSLTPSKKTLTLSGKVTGAKSAWLELEWPGTHFNYDASEASTTSGGKYSFKNVVPGSYVVSIWDTRNGATYSYKSPRKVSLTKSRSVTLPKATTLLYPRAVEYPTRVLYQGKPIAGLRLNSPESTLWSQATDENGNGTAEWDGRTATLHVVTSNEYLGGHTSPLYFTFDGSRKLTKSSQLGNVRLNGIGGA